MADTDSAARVGHLATGANALTLCARCGQRPIEVPGGDGSAPAHSLCRECGKASYGAWRFFRA